jgi:penicillin amidase
MSTKQPERLKHFKLNVNAVLTALLALTLAAWLLPAAVQAKRSHAGKPVRMPGLKAAAKIVRDVDGIAHIQAADDHDLFFLNGWVHAQDRLFQMDASRREASGTLAELLGASALPSDVELRTLGLRRAAERSLTVISARARAALEAYAEGVNAYVADHPLPQQYEVLELDSFAPWTAVDSLVIGKLLAFDLSFDLDINSTLALDAYVEAFGEEQGSALYFDDLQRSAPFNDAATVPDAGGHRIPSTSAAEEVARASTPSAAAGFDASWLKPETLELARRHLDKIRDIPRFRRILDRDFHAGSNEWAVTGYSSENRRPVIANDPHLALDTPSTLYPIGLEAGDIKAFGSGFAGTPFVILGYNAHISWGETTNGIDVTDTYQEEIVPDPDPNSPSGLATVYLGKLEPIIAIPEVFKTNNPTSGKINDITVVPAGGDIPAATLIVPRRNNGPIIELDLSAGTALSVQYTGFSGTRELECFLRMNAARNLDEFVLALQFFDFGSQNFVYTDDRGNVGYFTSAEMPLREDLQAGAVAGRPPYFIRNGTGGNEWLPVKHRQPYQTIPYEILPYLQMPKIVNPPAGFFVNANNDPAGITLDNNPLSQYQPQIYPPYFGLSSVKHKNYIPGRSIYYLAYNWSGGFRAGRITEMIRAYLRGRGKISFEDMQTMQADSVMLDAQVLTPYILAAFDNAAMAMGGTPLSNADDDDGVAEAVGRLEDWDFTTPPGIFKGYDASDENGRLTRPSKEQIQNSIAAAIYNVWRGQFIRNTIDYTLDPLGLPVPGSDQALAALKHLLENGGESSSGLDFFTYVPDDAAGMELAVRSDIVILQSLSDALALMASPDFGPAFGESTDQKNYRWGYLHRIVFADVLDGPFSIPPAGVPPLRILGDDLPGISVQGGYNTVDAATFSARADTLDGFMFGSGPVRRFVSQHRWGKVRSVSIWPGGVSEELGSPFYANLLPLWLTNDYVPLLLTPAEIYSQAAKVYKFAPPPKSRRHGKRFKH